MLLRIFLLLLTAHILADYAVQGQKLVNRKKEKRPGAFIIHVLAYTFLGSLLTLPWLSGKLLLIIALQTVIHAVIDYAKILVRTRKPECKFEYEVTDLALHVLTIGLTLYLCQPFPRATLIQGSFCRLLQNSLLYYRICIYLAAVVFLLRGCTPIVRLLLQKIQDHPGKISTDRTGRLIGNIERLLIFILVSTGNTAVVGLVITAKSIARFEELKNRQFAEYYLCGTLSSTLLALITALVTSRLLTILQY